MPKPPRILLTTSLLVALAVVDAGAALNDCGQPASNGARPTASDALFTLRAGVGAAVCDIRVCDVDSNCRVSATDALALLRAATGQGGTLQCAVGCFATTSTSTTSTTSTSTTTTLPATWSQVRDILVTNGCTLSGCHGSGAVVSGGLGNLDSINKGYTELLTEPVSCFGSSFDARVTPGDAGASFLVAKLLGTQDCGTEMPPGGASIPLQDIDAVMSWIDSGAPKN